MITLKNLVDAIKNAPVGSYCGIKNYIAENGDISSVIGKIGCSYINAKELTIKDLQTAIDNKDFEEIVVSGKCYSDGVEFNPRKRSWNLTDYNITYSKNKVIEMAKEYLESLKNPIKKTNNKIQLTEKENGLYYESNTGKLNITLLVEKRWYKDKKSNDDKSSNKIKATHPDSAVKNILRDRFEKKFRPYTIKAGKFEEISIGKQRFNSNDVKF